MPKLTLGAVLIIGSLVVYCTILLVLMWHKYCYYNKGEEKLCLSTRRK